MRRFTALALLLTLVAATFTMVAIAAEKPADGAKSGKLRHVVLFKFKDDAPAEKVAEIEAAFAALPEKIDTIVDFEWGTNNSPEGINQEFTHCFLVTFNDDAGRAVYLPHPAHKAFVELLKPQLDKVLVIDYVAK